MNRIIQARMIAALIAGLVLLNASTASATLILTLGSPGGTPQVVIADGFAANEEIFVEGGSIWTTHSDNSADGSISYGFGIFDTSGINPAVGGLNGIIEISSNASASPSSGNGVFSMSTNFGGAGSLEVWFSANDFENSGLNNGDPGVFTSTGTLTSSSSQASVESAIAYFDPSNYLLGTGGVPLTFETFDGGGFTLGESISKSTSLGGPSGDFSLTGTYLVNHAGNITSTFEMDIAVSTPEPGSLLVWGGISLAGVVMARRRRQKTAA